MAVRFNNKIAWLLLLVIAAAIVAQVATPVWLIQPFAAQTEGKVGLSYMLKSSAPVTTMIMAIAAVLLAVFIWRHSKRWSKLPLIVPLLIIFVFTWFARQNHFEWMFNPLKDVRFAKVGETDFVNDSDMVLAVKINGDAVAFPVRQMAYHHVVQDVVGGTPITATY